MRFRYSLVVFLAVGSSALAQQRASPRPAVPVEPIGAIIDAFRSHPVVALGEGSHGNEQGHAFRLSLIRDPRFAATVNDIVVESGNALYQEVMDRFVRGEEVPDDVIRRAWRDTTQPHDVWDRPISEEFFRAVRAVNASLPRQRQIRVLLGDPPIDWDSAPTPADRRQWLFQRDSYPAELVQREVIARRRRALMIYGDMHFTRKNSSPASSLPAGIPRAQSIVLRLESAGISVFSIHTATDGVWEMLQPGVTSWPEPSLALVHGTVLGAASFRVYLPSGPLMIGAGGKPAPEPDPQAFPRMEEQFDAVLYVGHPLTITWSRHRPALCADEAYIRMRTERTATMPTDWSSEFRASCAAPPPVIPTLWRTYRAWGIDAALAAAPTANDAYVGGPPNASGVTALDRFGQTLLKSGKLDDAIAIFRKNAEIFPGDARAHTSLGEAYAAKGETALAVTSYRRVLAISPDDGNARDALRQLEIKKPL
jgi:Tetratricopeptide repeat